MPLQTPWRLFKDLDSGRISSGFEELDKLLMGGIPEKSTVVLTSPSSDEREFLVKSFLKFGAESGEVTFHLTSKAENTKDLAEKYQSNFFLFIVNPSIDPQMQNLPNVIKLNGVESLNEVDIMLTKALRSLNLSVIVPMRACIEIVSDALLQHHALITRKWLGALLPELQFKGFTTLAVIDPDIHPKEETQAITSLFDGEMRISEKETAKGVTKSLRIRKLNNKCYLEKELVLTKDKIDKVFQKKTA